MAQKTQELYHGLSQPTIADLTIRELYIFIFIDHSKNMTNQLIILFTWFRVIEHNNNLVRTIAPLKFLCQTGYPKQKMINISLLKLLILPPETTHTLCITFL